jgi:hypothetical protein
MSLSPVSTYSASPLEEAYDLERTRQIRARMAQKIAKRVSRRRSTGETLNSASSIKSEAWLWDRHHRVHEWERNEAGFLAAARKAQADSARDRAYEEWKRGHDAH